MLPNHSVQLPPAGRVYVAYGGVYVATDLAWLWLIDVMRPNTWDVVHSAIAVLGMVIIMFAPTIGIQKKISLAKGGDCMNPIEGVEGTNCGVKSTEHQSAKDFADGCRVERGQLEEL